MEVETVIRYRPKKLPMLKLSVSRVVLASKHFVDGENHFSCISFSCPFSDIVRIALDTSMAMGEPFWNTFKVNMERNLIALAVIIMYVNEKYCGKNEMKMPYQMYKR